MCFWTDATERSTEVLDLGMLKNDVRAFLSSQQL
jgi:hypothetical protein